MILYQRLIILLILYTLPCASPSLRPWILSAPWPCLWSMTRTRTAWPCAPCPLLPAACAVLCSRPIIHHHCASWVCFSLRGVFQYGLWHRGHTTGSPVLLGCHLEPHLSHMHVLTIRCSCVTIIVIYLNNYFNARFIFFHKSLDIHFRAIYNLWHEGGLLSKDRAKSNVKNYRSVTCLFCFPVYARIHGFN